MIRVPFLRSLRTKLLLASLLIEATMLALLVGNGMRLIEQQLEQQLEVRVQAIELAYKTAVAVPLAARDYATLRDIIDGWRKSADVTYLVVTDPRLQILAASGWKQTGPLPSPSKEFVGGGVYHVAFNVELQGQVYGAVHYGLSTSYIEAAKRALFQQGALIALLELSLSIVMLLGTGYWLTRHLVNLAEASARVAEGDFSVRLEYQTRDEVGLLAHSFNAMTDAVRQRIAELSESEQRFRAIADHTYAWENWFGPDGQLRWVNPAVERLTGYKPRECLALRDFPMPLVFPDDQDLVRQQHQQALAGQTGQDLEFRVQCKDGKVIWVAMSWQPIFADDGASLGYRSSLRDITVQHFVTEELAFHASHDPLTGLYNRRAFEKHLTRSLEEATRLGEQVILVYIDLDQFKAVNDACGHSAGDSLLQHLAHVMQAKFSFGYLARLGGDEFGLIMRGVLLDEAVRRSQHIIDDIRAMPFAWEGKIFRLGASIGIVESSADLNTITDLLIAADTACYAAKERGRNRVQVFVPTDDYFRARQAEFMSLPQISAALEQGRFVLYHQRYQSLHPGRRNHIEVLVRMVGEDGKIIAPAYFIPAAERYNMMPFIDRWVIEHTCQLMARWVAAGATDLPKVALNLSGATLADDELPTFIRDTFARYGTDPAHISFEITESCAISQLDRAFEFIDFAHGLGCTLALDDFGSGLSSFGYLKQFKVDYLKIDGMFVKQADQDAADRAVVESMVRVAQVHGLATIAEFVSSEAVLEVVRDLGVDYAQGYAVHVPSPLLETPPQFLPA
ncbi:MAG TPA: EAL domain-containing protein [Azospira sp.]|nr:EAL domain-containing protein [Azospira sp.]